MNDNVDHRVDIEYEDGTGEVSAYLTSYDADLLIHALSQGFTPSGKRVIGSRLVLPSINRIEA